MSDRIVDSLDELAELQGFGDLAADDLEDVEVTPELSIDAPDQFDDDSDDTDDDDSGEEDREIEDLEELEDYMADYDDGDFVDYEVETSADYEGE